MLERDYLFKTMQAQGYVCIVDDYEELAVRVEKDGYYLKRKGRKEVRSDHYHAEKYLCELNNRLISRKEYDLY